MLPSPYHWQTLKNSKKVNDMLAKVSIVQKFEEDKDDDSIGAMRIVP